jgi:hypothetical protein
VSSAFVSSKNPILVGDKTEMDEVSDLLVMRISHKEVRTRTK